MAQLVLLLGAIPSALIGITLARLRRHAVVGHAGSIAQAAVVFHLASLALTGLLLLAFVWSSLQDGIEPALAPVVGGLVFNGVVGFFGLRAWRGLAADGRSGLLSFMRADHDVSP